MDWLENLLLGAVQGLTEFLPVSSDGHLTITQQAFDTYRGVRRSGAEKLFIEVVLHLGTLCAILLHYRRALVAGVRGLLGRDETGAHELDPDTAPEVDPGSYRRETVVRVLALAVVATLPAVPVGIFLKKRLEQTLEDPVYAGAGFLVTAVVLLITARLPGGTKGPTRMTWLDALLIGMAQMFAPLPGVSRSGLTIAAALALGLRRTWAVQFSLLMAVPVIGGAAILELRKADPSFLTGSRLGPLLAATVVAGVVGYGAIQWLVRVVRSGRIWYFSAYLVLLGLAVLAWSFTQGSSPDARPPQTLDRPAQSGRPALALRRLEALGDRRLAGPVRNGARPDPRRAWSPGRTGAFADRSDLD